MDTLISGKLYFWPPSQNPIFLDNSNANSVFLHSRKWPAPVTVQALWYQLTSRASTLYNTKIILQTSVLN